MRPTARPQSAIRYPLNHVFGTEAGVRVLREVMLSDIPIGAAELARRTALQLSGVGRVCDRLEQLGVIEVVGRGARNRQYRRAGRFQLGTPIKALFESERNRADQLMRELQQAVGATNGVRAAWIEGPAATGSDMPEETLVIGALVATEEMENANLNLWQRLLQVQQNYDLTVDLKLLSQADLETLPGAELAALEHVLPLSGPMPTDLILAPPERPGPRRGARRHEELDAASLGLAQRVADHIRRDPSLIEDALHWIERRLRTARGGEVLELSEWKSILTTMSNARLRRFLVSQDRRARRLRQSSPFAAVLPARGRRLPPSRKPPK